MANDSTIQIAIDGPAEAVEIAQRYGMIDGAHHKQWVIDRMLRAIMGPEGYAAWRAQKEWDEGIAP